LVEFCKQAGKVGLETTFRIDMLDFSSPRWPEIHKELTEQNKNKPGVTPKEMSLDIKELNKEFQLPWEKVDSSIEAAEIRRKNILEQKVGSTNPIPNFKTYVS